MLQVYYFSWAFTLTVNIWWNER